MQGAVELLTMVVLIGFTNPTDGEFSPVSYTFYSTPAEQCLAERANNTAENRRILCLDGEDETISVSRLPGSSG